MKDALIDYARKLHAGQKRKNGEDYAEHVIRVAHEAVLGVNFGYKLFAIGILHDSAENCNVSFIDLFSKLIEIGFKDNEVVEIIYAVNLLTKREDYHPVDYLLKIKKNDLARIVKIADLADNMYDLEKGNLLEKYKLSMYILNN